MKNTLTLEELREYIKLDKKVKTNLRNIYHNISKVDCYEEFTDIVEKMGVEGSTSNVDINTEPIISLDKNKITIFHSSEDEDEIIKVPVKYFLDPNSFDKDFATKKKEVKNEKEVKSIVEIFDLFKQYVKEGSVKPNRSSFDKFLDKYICSSNDVTISNAGRFNTEVFYISYTDGGTKFTIEHSFKVKRNLRGRK